MSSLLSALLLLTATLFTSSNAGPMNQRLLKHMRDVAFDASCWGEVNSALYYKETKAAVDKCALKEPLFTIDELFPKPEVDVLIGVIDPPPPSPPTSDNNGDSEDTDAEGDDKEELSEMTSALESFVANLDGVKENKLMKLSNLTCVMIEMKLWDEEFNVNMDTYNSVFNMDGLDDDFKEGVVREYQVCHALSQALPIDEKKMPPFARMFARQLLHAHCTVKHERMVCAKLMAARLAELTVGPFDPIFAKTHGLPNNRLDWGLAFLAAKDSAKGPIKRFVYDVVLDGDVQLA